MPNDVRFMAREKQRERRTLRANNTAAILRNPPLRTYPGELSLRAAFCATAARPTVARSVSQYRGPTLPTDYFQVTQVKLVSSNYLEATWRVGHGASLKTMMVAHGIHSLAGSTRLQLLET